MAAVCFALQLLSTVTGKCTTPEEKGGTLCLPDIESLQKMQQELMEKKVDITLYLAFGFKQLSGENSASYPRQGKCGEEKVLCPNITDYIEIKDWICSIQWRKI
jgi:hypothetical protein